MQIELSFTTKEIEQLYLTYKRNPANYAQIKEKVVGENPQQSFRKNRKNILFFFVAVTFIISVSSTFSLVADHWDSFVALWMIWSIAFVLLLISLFIMYKTTSQIYTKNQAFFQKFERTANASETLHSFSNNW